MGLCDVVHLQFSTSDADELFSQIAVSGQLQVNLNALESKANTVHFEGLRRQVLLKAQNTVAVIGRSLPLSPVGEKDIHFRASLRRVSQFAIGGMDLVP